MMTFTCNIAIIKCFFVVLRFFVGTFPDWLQAFCSHYFSVAAVVALLDPVPLTPTSVTICECSQRLEYRLPDILVALNLELGLPQHLHIAISSNLKKKIC